MDDRRNSKYDEKAATNNDKKWKKNPKCRNIGRLQRRIGSMHSVQ